MQQQCILSPFKIFGNAICVHPAVDSLIVVFVTTADRKRGGPVA